MAKRNIFVVKVVVCLVFIWQSACQSAPESNQQLLRHVVTFQFKDEIGPKRRSQAIQDFLELKDLIPQIIKFEGGEDISTEGLSQGFTHCFVLTFKNEADRDAYLPHPAHLELAEKNKPLMKKLLVVDVWGEE